MATGIFRPRAGWMLPLICALPLANAESACDAAKCELRFEITATPGFSEAALSARRELTVGDHAQVLDHDAPGFISNLGSATRVGNGARIGGVFAAGDLVLGDSTRIGPDIYAFSVQPEARVAERARRHAPGTETLAMGWTITFPALAEPPVIVAPAARLALSPAYYRELRVNANAVATLRTGTYYFDSLTVARGAHLAFDDRDGTVVIHVREFLAYDGGLEYTAAHSDLLLNYFGTRRVDLDSKFDGTLFAPYATLVLHAAGTHEGVFHADILRLDNGATVKKTRISGRGAALARLRTQSRDEAGRHDNVVSKLDERNGGMPFPDTAVGRVLNDAFFALNAVGPDANEVYAEARRQLKANAEAVMPMLVSSYDALPQSLETQVRRLSLVEMMRLTGSEASYEPLLAIARSPMNPALLAMPSDEQSRPTLYEDIIRARAINGIGEVARGSGSGEATQVLLDFALHGAGLQQQYAAREYLASGDREAHRAVLRERLPPKLQYLARIDGTTH
jgi:hypothetical protein